MNTANRYTNLLRIKMLQEGIDYIIIDDADPYNSEYVSDYYKLRTVFSGFTGSNGCYLVGIDKAWLWTDGRYFIQAENEIEASDIVLMKMGKEDVPTLYQHISKLVEEKDGITRIMLCGQTFSYNRFLKLSDACDMSKVDIKYDDNEAFIRSVLKETDIDNKYLELVTKPVKILSNYLYTVSAKANISKIRDNMAQKGADVFISNALDSNMFVLNIRGDDIQYNPVSYSYMIITPDTAILYSYDYKNEALREYLQSQDTVLKNIDSFYEDIEQYDSNNRVMMDFRRINVAVADIIYKSKAKIINDDAGIEVMKAVKGQKEINAIKRTYLDDSVAVCKFLYWLSKQDLNKDIVTEYDCAMKMDELRLSTRGCNGLSFNTIAAYAENAAMMHYEATKAAAKRLMPKGMFLLDSGGQYDGGTTDVTRTVAVGEITKGMKEDYTRVVRGMLALQNAVFMKGVTGINLDILARGPLWDSLSDYKCGTGHGIGYMLNVHEGPQAIRWKVSEDGSDAKIVPGMLVSDEPGVYKAGEYGIRMENILLCVEKGKTEDGEFYSFEPLTFVPIDMRMIIREELQPKELKWLNDYQWKVNDMVSEYLTDEEKQWLKNVTIFA